MHQLIVPDTKPFSPDTWEISQALLATNPSTARIPVSFPEPYMIVGCYPSVIATTNEVDLRDPTPDDILVKVDLNLQRVFTSTNDMGVTTAAGRGESFITLSALNTKFRDLQIVMDNPNPVLGMTFRWKIEDDATREGLYQDCIIAVSLFCTRMRER